MSKLRDAVMVYARKIARAWQLDTEDSSRDNGVVRKALVEA